MGVDESLPRPVRPRGRVVRLASPVGLVLAGLCLFLPFLTASCSTGKPHDTQWRVTYTGIDVIAGGRPDIAFTEDAQREPIHELGDADVRRVLGGPAAPLPAQPVAWLAVALLTAAFAASLLTARFWRTTVTAGLAVAAAVVLWGATVLARRDATDAVATVLSQFAAARRSPRRRGRSCGSSCSTASLRACSTTCTASGRPSPPWLSSASRTWPRRFDVTREMRCGLRTLLRGAFPAGAHEGSQRGKPSGPDQALHSQDPP